MRTPDSLASLAEFGVIEQVLRPLMSGKEAHVFLVVSAGKECIAKVYKEAQARAFKNRSEYTEGRGTRNTRDQRAMGKRTGYGRERNEEAWHSTEVDMLRLLHRAGVRVPTPLRYAEGVLLMELVTDEEGDPAPRLGDVNLSPADARAVYDELLRQVIRMLCAGVVHGDLSDFNVLMGTGGPVIIDLPQAVDASRNPHARKMLVRDVDNLHRFLLRHAPGTKIRRYAEEMWDLYQNDALTPDTQLAGDYVASTARADTASVLDMIDDAEHDERIRRENLGLPAGRLGPPRRRGPAPPSRGSRPHHAARPAHPKPPTQPPAHAHAPRKGGPKPGSRASVAAMMKAVEKGGPEAIAPKPKPRAPHAPHAPRPPHEPPPRPPQRRRRPR